MKRREEKPRKQMREETSDMHNLMPSTKQLQRSQKVGTRHKQNSKENLRKFYK